MNNKNKGRQFYVSDIVIEDNVRRFKMGEPLTTSLRLLGPKFKARILKGRPKVHRNCPCGKLFIVSSANKKYCGPACKDHYYRLNKIRAIKKYSLKNKTTIAIKKSIYDAQYGQRPEVKERKRLWAKEKRLQLSKLKQKKEVKIK